MKKFIAILTGLAMLLSMTAMLAACGEEPTPSTTPTTTTPAHTHDFGTEWKTDSSNHWNECACGEKSNTAVHTDADVNGKCDVCSADVPLPVHEHEFGTEWKSDETNHWNECECGEKANEAAHTDADVNGKCDVCSADVPLPPHEHAYGAEWKSDETNHWNECECGEKANEAAHTDADVNGKCDVCSADVPLPPHEHAYGSWITDENNHWKVCECGEKANEAAHADTDTNGKCDTCEYEMTPPAPVGDPLVQGNNVFGVPITGGEKTFVYTATEEVTLKLTLKQYGMQNSSMVMGANYAINGGEPVELVKNQMVELELVAGDTIVVYAHSTREGNIVAEFIVKSATPTENPLTIGVNTIQNEDITFSYTAPANGKLTLKLTANSMFGAANTYLVATYTINGTQTGEIAKGATAELELNAGDVVVIAVEANTGGKLTATWEGSSVVTPAGNTLQMGENAIAGEDITFEYTAETNGTLTIKLIKTSSSLRDVMTVTYTVNGGEAVSVTLNTDTAITLNAGDKVAVIVETNCAGTLTATWEGSSVVPPAGNTLQMGENAIAGEDITFEYTAETNGTLTIKLIKTSSSLRDVMTVTYTVNGGEAVSVTLNTDTAITLNAGDKVAVIVETNCAGTLTAAWEAAAAGNALQLGENAVAGEDITFEYTAEANGTLTIKLIKTSSSLRDVMTVTYTVNGGEAVSVTLNTDTAITLNAGDKVAVIVETNCAGTLTAAWEAAAAGNALQLGENAVAGEDITFTYTADANGKLTIKLIKTSSSLRDVMTVTYTVNGGETVTVTLNADTEIVLNAGDKVVITIETNCAGTLTAAWTAA